MDTSLLERHEIAELRREVSALRDELRGEIGAMHRELRAESRALWQERSDARDRLIQLTVRLSAGLLGAVIALGLVALVRFA